MNKEERDGKINEMFKPTKLKMSLIPLTQSPEVITWDLNFAKSLGDMIANWTLVSKNEKWRLNPDTEINKDNK